MGEFITPPSLPPTTYCRRLLIPNSPEWIGTVTGALMSLIYESGWTQTTGITAEEASDRARVMFNLYLDSGNDGECGDMACCGDQVIIQRFNPDTGRPEVSKDGGVTWTPDPADPENKVVLYPSPIGTPAGSTKCDAATNASEHVNELITSTATNISTAGDVFSLTVAIAEAVLALVLVLVSAGSLTPIVTAVATAVWGAGTAAFALGVDGFNDYWTTDKKDAILCALYCFIGEDGQFTEDQYQGWRAKVKEQLPASPALDIVMTSINATGARGLSQMASYGNAADADCSSCECEEFIEPYVRGNGDLGTFISYTGHTLTAQTVPTAGTNRLFVAFDPAVVGSDVDPNNTICGSLFSIDFSPLGTDANLQFIQRCGETGLVAGIFGVPTVCVCQAVIQSSVPVTVTITAKPC